MNKYITRLFALLLFATIFIPSADAQRRYRYYTPRRHYYSTSDRVLRSLDAVETAIDYAILGSWIHRIDDYTGVRLGLNSATLRASGSGFDDPSTHGILGANVGLVFGWYLGKSPVSIEPGIYYSMKGGRLTERYPITGSKGYSIDETKFTMHSFEIPVVFKYAIPLEKGIAIEPFAGTFMSFGFDGTTTLNNGDKHETFEDGYLEDFDAGLRFGVGLAIDHVCFEAAYDLGLVNQCDSYIYGRNAELRTNTWSFSIGYNF